MGIVYEAVQLSLGRRVALKVLPFAAALDARQLQRFKTEAQAAAGLHHTNIVPVHAVGSERGVHYYAMQLIDGRPLDAVIREWHGEVRPDVGSTTVQGRAGPTSVASGLARTGQRSERGRESYRTVARISAQVADALEYAHEAGVVHRDIKPANLLLDGRGTVWVTDFGLAQVATDVGLTQTGDVVGTLRYMSPEQAGGQRVLVDHRTDIYSLGATLYELLTLWPIFAGQNRPTLFRQILEEEPRPPRQIDRSIPVELETIVLKALAKAPEERYATAAEMAADLRRFLDDRPILARRPSLLERARKWMRRHPALVGAAVVLLMVVVIALAVTTALVAREQARTQARADEAEERFRLAQRAADEIIQVADEELADKPHLESVRKRLLEAALSYYQELIEHRREHPKAKGDLEATRDRVKKIIADLAALQGMRQFRLLEKAVVLDELCLNAVQRERLAEWSRRWGEQRQQTFLEFHRMTHEQRRGRFLDEARGNDAAIRAILTPRQLDRLRQIALQVRWLGAFQDTEVVAALRLTVDQRERIRDIEMGLFFGQRPPWGPPGRPGPPGGPGPGPRPGPGPGPGPAPVDEQALKAAFAKALAVLTKEQVARWKVLTGEPFEAAGQLFDGPFRLFLPEPPGPPPRR